MAKEGTPSATVVRGLEGIVAATTRLSFIDGQQGILIYRGINIHDLAEKSTFEEVVYLLWNDDLPTREQLERFSADLAAQRVLAPEVLDLMRSLPKAAHPMSVLRTAVSAIGLFDPQADDISPEANRGKAMRLTAQIPTMIAAFDRLRQGKEPIAPRQDLSHTANFLYMLTGQTPDETSDRALDVYLILLADHGFNASTFACRVAAATLSDMYSAITSGIGTLKGPLHGGANEKAMKMLLQIGDVAAVEGYVKDELAAGRRIMGFGHRVYKTEDPRATQLRRMSKAIGDVCDPRWYEISRKVEEVMWETKRLYCNVDFYSASVLYCLGIAPDLFTPVFAMSRIAGWTAHVLEQQADNRLIRPRAQYVGPTDRTYIPIEQRE